MKKRIVLATLILGASFIFTACTHNNNLPHSQNTDGQNTNSTYDNSEITNVTSDNSEITSITSSIEMTDINLSTVGGNPDIANYIEVTVSEDKYFYENHEILYDDLIKVFKELDENTAVMISDENATLKAYKRLTKALEECGILYESAKKQP